MTAKDLSSQAAVDEGSVACCHEVILLYRDLGDFETTDEVRVAAVVAQLETVYAGPDRSDCRVETVHDLRNHVVLSVAVLVLYTFEMSELVERL